MVREDFREESETRSTYNFRREEVSSDLNPSFVALAWEASRKSCLYVEAREWVHRASVWWPMTPEREGSYQSSVFALLLWCWPGEITA